MPPRRQPSGNKGKRRRKLSPAEVTEAAWADAAQAAAAYYREQPGEPPPARERRRDQNRELSSALSKAEREICWQLELKPNDYAAFKAWDESGRRGPPPLRPALKPHSPDPPLMRVLRAYQDIRRQRRRRARLGADRVNPRKSEKSLNRAKRLRARFNKLFKRGQLKLFSDGAARAKAVKDLAKEKHVSCEQIRRLLRKAG